MKRLEMFLSASSSLLNSMFNYLTNIKIKIISRKPLDSLCFEISELPVKHNPIVEDFCFINEVFIFLYKMLYISPQIS